LEELNSDELKINEISFNLERIKISTSSTEKLEELNTKFKDDVLKKNIEFELSEKKEFIKLSKKLEMSHGKDKFIGTIGAIIKSLNGWYALTAAHNFFHLENSVYKKKNGDLIIDFGNWTFQSKNIGDYFKDWQHLDIGWIELPDEINFETTMTTNFNFDPLTYSKQVVKIGIETGRTFGVVEKVITSGGYTNQLRIDSLERFGDYGDSGSLLILYELGNEIKLHPIGIFHSVVDNYGQLSYACPLNLDFFKKLEKENDIEFNVENVEFAFFNGQDYFKIK
jgi:hypothetical protein